MEYKIEEKTVTQILQYLATQPYNQVVQLIGEIQKVQVIKDSKK